MDTEKALESHERGIPAIKPEWIYECCRKWEKLDWNPFKLMIKQRNTLKRSAAELDEEEEEGNDGNVIEEIATFEPILDEAELEEIEKELLDLEDSDGGSDCDDDDCNDDDDGDVNSLTSNTGYSGAELSDGDFSDLLNYSSSSANESGGD